MPTASSVVTATRFATGLPFADFLAQAAVNRDKFEANYADAPLTASDLAFFKQAREHGAVKVMCIAEAWCGDVYRELPTMARIAEAAGMELRIFLRDKNPDMMDEFLKGTSRAIPIFAFYTDDMRYLTHFTERSATAHAELEVIANQVRKELNLPLGAPPSTFSEADRAAFLKELIPRLQLPSNQWRKDAIKELREMLASSLHIPNPAN